MAGERLRSAVERIERLHEEKRTIEEDIKAIYAEIASEGYDKKALREVVKRRAKDPDERSEFEAVVELYEQAISGPSRAYPRDAREAAETEAFTTSADLPQDAPRSLVTTAPIPPAEVAGHAGFISEGSEQESVVGDQARNEPGSDLTASGGGGVKASPETPDAIRSLSNANAIAAAAISGQPRSVPTQRTPIDLTIPEFLRRTREPATAD